MFTTLARASKQRAVDGPWTFFGTFWDISENFYGILLKMFELYIYMFGEKYHEHMVYFLVHGRCMHLCTSNFKFYLRVGGKLYESTGLRAALRFFVFVGFAFSCLVLSSFFFAGFICSTGFICFSRFHI